MTKRSVLATAAALIAVTLGMVWTQAAAQRDGDKQREPDKKKKETPRKDKDKDKDKDKSAAVKTHKVEAKPFRIELSLKGALEPREATWIAHHPMPTMNLPYSPGPMSIVRVAEHGAKVRKGDLLISFDTRKIDQAIHMLEAEQRVLAAGIKLAEQEQPLLERSVPIELEQAERGKRDADEDLAYFLKTARAETEKRANNYVKYAAFSYEFAKEQLRQLEKMYKANDLTEETEQIILKRQRFFVEDAANDLKSAEVERDYVLKTILPRKEKTLQDSVVRHGTALDKARTTLAPAVTQKQQALAKMRFDHDKIQAGIDMLQKDRAAMTIKSPADGIVYYGKLSKGQWESASASAAKLVPNGSVSPDEVFTTIVAPQPSLVRLQVDEKDLHLLTPGLEGKAQMVFDPQRKLPAQVTNIAKVPAAPGKFEILVFLKPGPADDLMPGMACTVKLVPYSKKQAVVVPSAAVFEEDDKTFVEVMKDGKREERTVTVGHTHDGQTEIRTGLRAGEEILLERSTDKKSAPAAGADEG
jgi:HlyD family secretion protein